MSLEEAPQTDGISDARWRFPLLSSLWSKSVCWETEEWLLVERGCELFKLFQKLVGEIFFIFSSLLSFVPDNNSLSLASRDRLQAEQNWAAETNWFLPGTGLAPGYQLMKFSDQFYILSSQFSLC